MEMLSQELREDAGSKTVNMGVAGTWLVSEALGLDTSSGERDRHGRGRLQPQDLRTLHSLSLCFSR